MAEKYKISESWMGVWVRTGPGVNYSKKTVIYGKDNKEYEVTERQNNYWLHIPSIDGWCCDRDSNGMMVMTKISTTTTVTVTPDPTPQQLTTVDEESYSYIPESMDMIVTSEEEYMNSLDDNFTIQHIRGIFGMPYQFMENADPRVTSKPGAIGRKFAKEIVSNMPILLLIPGTPVFMGDYTEKEKENMLKSLIEGASDKAEEIGDFIFSKKFGKYYSMEPKYVEYYKYVNPMCRAAARIMNLQDKKIDGTSLDEFNWAFNTNKAFNKLFSIYSGCTAWYCDSETSIDDSFSNDTTQSVLADKVNGISDYGRELNFLLGTTGANLGIQLDGLTNAEALSGSITNINSFIDNALGKNKIGNVFKSLTNSVQTVVAGGKIVFPEIWSSSSFSRSYNIKLKLVSPSGDDLSVYLNIIVPILHLLGLVLPREAADTGRAYISPFLVKGFYKGLFNVDLGIITDLSITKGKESAWTPSGIPTIAEVSFTIKDLYSDMFMTNMDNIKHNTINNIILMDYIGNLCGVNINEVDILRGIDMFLTQNGKNRLTDTWQLNYFLGLQQWVTNKYQSIFSKF